MATRNTTLLVDPNQEDRLQLVRANLFRPRMESLEVMLVGALVLGLMGVWAWGTEAEGIDAPRPLRREEPKDASGRAGQSERVVELGLDQLFASPVGPRGMEYSTLALELSGKRVRLRGFVVRQAWPIPWCVLLSPLAMTLHEREYGLCDDLPMNSVHVLLPRSTTPTQPNRPGPQEVIGTLELGPREEADGRRSVARVRVSPQDFVMMGWVSEPFSSGSRGLQEGRLK